MPFRTINEMQSRNTTNRWQDGLRERPWSSSATTVACRAAHVLRSDCTGSPAVRWKRYHEEQLSKPQHQPVSQNKTKKKIYT